MQLKNFEQFLAETSQASSQLSPQLQRLVQQHFEVKGNLWLDDHNRVCTDGSVRLLDSTLRRFPFSWGTVKGNFVCSYSTSLQSLEGAPREVGRDFDCSECTALQSLRGAPEVVGRNFDCSYCSSLRSLEGG
jgi:hypothetical protein